jgi:hypothetical protein
LFLKEIKSLQVAVAKITEDLKLFDAPIQEGGRTADVFFNLTLPIDAVRPAFRLEFDSDELNGVNTDDIHFHEISGNLYKCFKDATEYRNVIWSDAIADASQNKVNRSWRTYTESQLDKDKKITSLTHGMLLRAGTGNDPNDTLKYEMAEMAVKAHFDAPLDLLDNTAEIALEADVANQDNPLNIALRNQLQTNKYSIDGSTGGLKSLGTDRPVRRGICESLFASGMSQDADGNQTTDDFLTRIDNLVHKWKLDGGATAGSPLLVTDPSNANLNNVKIETYDGSSNHILMDFPMAVGDKIQLTLIYAVQSKLQTADLNYAVGPYSSRKNQTNKLRELYGSRVDGYEHSGQVSLTTDLSGESLAYVGGVYNEGVDISQNRYGPLFMDTISNPATPQVVSFSDSQNSDTYFSFMNRVAQIEITLTESGSNSVTTFLKPAA